MEELIWKCHICGRERPDFCISVISYSMVNCPEATINVRYCNDNSACLEKALEWKSKGELPKKEESIMKLQEIKVRNLKVGYKTINSKGEQIKIKLIEKIPGNPDLYNITFETGAEIILTEDETMLISFEHKGEK